MTLGSLFDGIGGFPLAAIRNNITPLWASEIEKFPIEVTKIHFPNMIHVGDITKLNGEKLPPVDIITGGSPCQGLSVAGMRKGLSDERSGLFMEQIRITKEMRCADERRGRTGKHIRPRMFLWENVPGAFSSANGEDFKAVLEETVRIADCGLSIPRSSDGSWKSAGCILGDKFSLAWRVLDAQYWGLAQRRKRIFLVADFGGHTAPKILFEQDSLFGNTQKSETQRERTATTVRSSAENTGRAIVLASSKPNAEICENLSPTVTASAGQGGGNTPLLFENHSLDCRYKGPLEVAPTLMSHMGSGGNNVPLVKQDIYCIAANTIGREAHNGGNGLGVQKDLSYTLTTADIPAVFEPYQKVVGALMHRDHKGVNSCYVNQDKCIVESSVFGQSSYGGYDTAVSTLTASGGTNGGGSENLAVSRNLVRRLTPLECERLQGLCKEKNYAKLD